MRGFSPRDNTADTQEGDRSRRYEPFRAAHLRWCWRSAEQLLRLAVVCGFLCSFDTLLAPLFRPHNLRLGQLPYSPNEPVPLLRYRLDIFGILSEGLSQQ